MGTSDFVIKIPKFVLLIIFCIAVLAGGYAILWMLFGYFLGIRADRIAAVGDKIGKDIVEKVKERQRQL